MNVSIYRNARLASRAAAALVVRSLERNPASVLGLPTGRTSVAVYDQLVRHYAAGSADFSRVFTFNLDEFIGVGAEDRSSFRAFMDRHFFDRVNIPDSHIHFLDGTAEDLDAECLRFEAAIRAAGGIDLMLLGIGANGHIGFNEPGRSLIAATHRARLTPATRRTNAPLFGGRLSRVPREALSMGMGTILASRAIILIATGRSKARAIQALLAKGVTTSLPASFLQLHGSVELILDSAAASRVSRSC
jgi:glucosamine-6-phosphate deaminase